MPASSQDLRQRVLDAVQRKEGSIRQIARRFVVSLSFVVRLLQLHRRTGSVEPKPPGGGRHPALGPDDLERLRELVRQQPDATLDELRQRLGVACSTMAICRALRKLKLPRKKQALHAQERDTPKVKRKRRVFRKKVARIDPDRLVFVDETGANTAMTRTQGRGPKGQRVEGAVPGPWETVTLIGGLRLSGVTAAMAFHGATDTGPFQEYVEEVLVPELQPGDVVIWDNLTPHKAEAVVEAVEEAGAEVIPLPSSSPDLTPIEEMSSKVKGTLRSASPRTTEAIYAAMCSALHDVTPEDIWGWFQDRAAYAFQT
jgi:transposase